MYSLSLQSYLAAGCCQDPDTAGAGEDQQALALVGSEVTRERIDEACHQRCVAADGCVRGRNGGRDRDSALADAFEALVGAIYLDGGFTKVRRFILTQFQMALDEVDASQHIGNPKGELQELLQAGAAVSPEYRLLDASGPDHDRIFICAVRHEGRELARGKGKNKKLAEAQAAAAAVSVLKKSRRKRK